MLAANQAVDALLGNISAKSLLEPPVNVLHLSLHPGGLAPMIANLSAWREHLFKRLRDQIDVTAGRGLIALCTELLCYPAPEERGATAALPVASEVFMPLVLDMPFGRLSFFSTTTVFGTPVDVTLSEIAIEAFFPADEEARRLLMMSGETARQKPPSKA